ncbi:MAG: hypothetical protein ACYS22_11895 [Planctomycetota bacterium]|jgi:hypothetical protein
MNRCAATLFTLVLLVAGIAQQAEADPFFRGDLTHHPRTFFDARDTAHIARTVQRINAQEQPWAAAYNTLRSLAEQHQVVDHRNLTWSTTSDPYVTLYSSETRNGQIAMAKAVVGWLYTKGANPSWRPMLQTGGSVDRWVKDAAAESARIIEQIYDEWPCYKGFKVINRGIVAASSLQNHCLAYDFLAALPSSLRPALGTAEERLSDMASDFSYWKWTLDGTNSNHGLRVVSGLGIAAVVLNRHDSYRWWKPGTYYHRPKRWIAKVENELHPTDRGGDLRFQQGNGGYAEGSSYYQYANALFLPFMFNYNRFLSGGGVPFLRSDLVADAELWNAELRLPSGARPSIDNSQASKHGSPVYFLSRVPGGVRSTADRDALHWDWLDAGRPSGGLSLLGAYDPTAQSLATAQAKNGIGTATKFFTEEGEAVLRSGWGRNDGYALVMAENGEARTHGSGHDSVDNLAYTYFTHGDFVTLHPGYPGWSRVEETNKGEHQSMVLVDGKAPKPAHKVWGLFNYVSAKKDSFIKTGPRTKAGTDISTVLAESSYENARIQRTAGVVGKRYFFYEDHCVARRAKTYTNQVQTNGGDGKGRPITFNGTAASYETNRGRLPVAVNAVATAPISVSKTARFDALESPRGHDAIMYEARGEEVTFLTAIAAEPQGTAAPSVEAIPVSGALALRVSVGGATDVVISNRDGGTVTVPARAGTQAITTSAELVVVSFPVSGAHSVLTHIGPGNVTVGGSAPSPSPNPTTTTSAPPRRWWQFWKRRR